MLFVAWTRTSVPFNVAFLAGLSTMGSLAVPVVHRTKKWPPELLFTIRRCLTVKGDTARNRLTTR